MSNVTDPELALMEGLCVFLDAMDEPTRHRVLVWLVARYYPQLLPPPVHEARARVCGEPTGYGAPFHPEGE